MTETVRPTPIPNSFFVDDAIRLRLEQAAMSKRTEYGKNGRNIEAPFRASELGDIVNAMSQDGEPAGCARRPFYSFFREYVEAKIPLDARAVLNFGRGDLEEQAGGDLLEAAGLLKEKHVMLGAWDPKNRDPRWRADPRYPDRSGGRARGDVDFVINHPGTCRLCGEDIGEIPLDWKSSSTYAFKTLHAIGGKPDNVVQVAWYAYEMRKSHYALGYVNKETGALVIVTYHTPVEWVEGTLFPACDEFRERLRARRIPPRPEGLRAAENGYDRIWPCYMFSPKKETQYICGFYRECHGQDPPEMPAKKKAIKKKSKAKPAAPTADDLEFE